MQHQPHTTPAQGPTEISLHAPLSALSGPPAAPIDGPLHQVTQFGPSRPVDEEIGSGIARLYKVIYGERYISPLYSDPKRICTEINEGRWHAFVGFDANGRVAGQVGMMLRPDSTFELGRDVVDPDARLRGSYKQLVRTRGEYVQKLIDSGDHTVDYQWAESVTGHEGSQRTYKNTLGFVPCGIGALKYPDVFGRGQRESVVLMVKIVNPEIRCDRPLYVPGELNPLVGEIFNNLGCARTFEKTVVAPTGLDTLNFAVRDKRQVGQIGFDFCPEKTDAVHDVTMADDLVRTMRDEDDIHHFSARMSLQDPRTPALARLLAENGFTFSHIEPRGSRDILELQKIVGDEALDVKVIDEAMARMVAQIEATRRFVQ